MGYDPTDPQVISTYLHTCEAVHADAAAAAARDLSRAWRSGDRSQATTEQITRRHLGRGDLSPEFVAKSVAFNLGIADWTTPDDRRAR